MMPRSSSEIQWMTLKISHLTRSPKLAERQISQRGDGWDFYVGLRCYQSGRRCRFALSTVDPNSCDSQSLRWQHIVIETLRDVEQAIFINAQTIQESLEIAQ